ncbi:MAG TPA: sulfur transferase domain-containing protein [Gemmatimonadaceae bacterium]|nr:sulfur transferase domain-containing protein [Gemmatimonadaceae bacterium]
MSSTTLESVLSTIPYGTCPLPGVGAAGQPGSNNWKALASAGVRTVVDLRAPNEPRGHDEPDAVRAAGMAYVSIPVTQATLGDEQFDAVRKLVGDPARRPIVVHCASSNRVGALLLPYFVLDEKQPLDKAIELAMDAGLRSQELAALALEYVRRHSASP